MKLKKLWLGLIITFGVLLTGNQQVQAEIITGEGTYASGYQPIKIYADPETTEYTGTTLANTVDQWKIVRFFIQDNTAVALDLGHNQWVKPSDTRTISPATTYIAYVNSANRATPVYSNAVFTDQIATLTPTISEWKITRIGQLTGTEINAAYDLGDNQWVKASDVVMIPSVVNYAAGTTLYDTTGAPVGEIKATLPYKILESHAINNHVYVRLGTDNQWALYATLS